MRAERVLPAGHRVRRMALAFRRDRMRHSNRPCALNGFNRSTAMAIRIRSTTLAALGVAAVLVAACDRRDNTVVRADSAGGTVVKTDTLNRSFTDNDWTEESILAYLRAQDRDEIKVNELAAKKATTPAVKQFAAKMVSDHRAGLKEVESMMKKTGTKADSRADTVHAADTVHERAHDVLNKT